LTSRPTFLDVVWCYFPTRERPAVPGSKARPVLILGLSEDGSLIAAAYGTSQAHRAPRSFEVVHEAHPGTFTTFDLSRLAKVPHSSAYFPSIPKLQPFPERRVPELLRARAAAHATG
jgi:hypothetical protein